MNLLKNLLAYKFKIVHNIKSIIEELFYKCYNIVENSFLKVERGVKKISEQRKRWLVAHSIRELKRLTKRNKRKPAITNSIKPKASNKPIIVRAPKHFSLIENPYETIKFFEEVFDNINNIRIGQVLFFDLKNVELITPDAVMYLLAVVKNARRLISFKTVCGGNEPQYPPAKELIIKSGFYKFVNSLAPRINTDSNGQIQITNGSEANNLLAGQLCDFVHRVSGSSRLDTKRLFPMIIELMTNTHQHAYKSSGKMIENWFLYAEDRQDCIHFIFLDTGVGIPATIRINFMEKIERFFEKNDAKFIASALKGEFRTETKEEHRGKGLPEIYNDCMKHNITNLIIVSNSGICKIQSDGAICEQTLETSLQGTLFYWAISKNEIGGNGCVYIN